jgi:hypothetical protein
MKQSSKPLSSAQLNAMRPGDKDVADSGENRGLRVSCGNAGTKSFYYRYTSPMNGKLTQIQIGHFPAMSLAEARVQLRNLKLIRKEGRCPSSEQKQEKSQTAAKKETTEDGVTVKDVIDFYLTQHIEDKIISGRRIPGVRKKKGQSETRRTLYGDAVRVMGDHPASKVTRQNVVDLIMEVVSRGANVQAGNVLRELTAAYEYAIGLGKFADEFANPALLAKSSLRQAKIKLTSNRGKRALSDPELKKFLQWLPGSVFTPTQKNILRFTLWTGCCAG